MSRRLLFVEYLPDSVAIGLSIGWAGLWCHEWFRVPAVFGLTNDGSLPFLVVVAVLIAWRHRPIGLAIGFGIVHLVGAIATVLPLPLLPFSPEQTLTHYLAHAIYAMAQVPLFVATRRHAFA
ncbi:MAG TPA: hypothetical protein VGL99_15380 [Chloroflexota bacterium]|jgi:hypothetical protein